MKLPPAAEPAAMIGFWPMAALKIRRGICEEAIISSVEVGVA
ncbi:hypothetical protein ACFP3I_21900 [Chryseobacterium arachidis]